MSEQERGKRDGTGPYKDSYIRAILKKKKGRRQLAGEECPVEKKALDEKQDDEKQVGDNKKSLLKNLAKSALLLAGGLGIAHGALKLNKFLEGRQYTKSTIDSARSVGKQMRAGVPLVPGIAEEPYFGLLNKARDLYSKTKSPKIIRRLRSII